jgi:phosphatidylcholine synthase
MARIRVLTAWLVHLYTASGAVLALLALDAIIAGEVRRAFLWLAGSVFIDATDGWLARRTNVRARVPLVDGALLDNIIDYLTYVFVPAYMMVRLSLLSPGFAWPTAAAVLLSSGYGFSRTDAKTSDHFFTGFPSYWNIVVFYLYATGLPAPINTGIVLGLAVMVFVPIGYVYPSRTTTLRTATILLGGAWAIAIVVAIWQIPGSSPWLVWGSLFFPAYYFLLSLFLHDRRARAG